jgi:hypothetical protein
MRSCLGVALSVLVFAVPVKAEPADIAAGVAAPDRVKSARLLDVARKPVEHAMSCGDSIASIPRRCVRISNRLASF